MSRSLHGHGDPVAGRRRLVACVLLAAVIAVGVGVGLARGMAFPPAPRAVAEPYRYVERPVGSREAPQAGSVSGETLSRGGRNVQGLSLLTPEPVPQVVLFLPPDSLEGQGRIRVDVTPLGPTAVADQVRVAGNVVRVDMVDDSGQVELGSEAHLSLFSLRADEVSDSAAVWFRPVGGQAWELLPSARLRGDLYGGDFAGAGEYAVVVPIDRSSDLLLLAVQVVVASAAVSLGLTFFRRYRTERQEHE